jgi:hypothetical protein
MTKQEYVNLLKKAGVSIYDKRLDYFAKRLSPENSEIKTLQNLFEKQNYLCFKCKWHLLTKKLLNYINRINS